MGTVVAMLLILAALSACTGTTLTDVKNAPTAVLPSMAQVEPVEEPVRYGVEIVIYSDTVTAEDGTALVQAEFQVPVLTVLRNDGTAVTEAENEQETQALAVSTAFNDQFSDWTSGMEVQEVAGLAEEELAWRTQEGMEWPGAYTLTLTSGVYQTDSILSVSMVYDSYTGGAHPNSCLLAWNFDLEEGVFFTPAVLAADSQAFTQRVQRELVWQARTMALEYETEPEEFFWPEYEDILGDWTSYTVFFDATGMTVAFSPYELASYAAGPQVFHLTYDQITPYLSTHGQELLGQQPEAE